MVLLSPLHAITYTAMLTISRVLRVKQILRVTLNVIFTSARFSFWIILFEVYAILWIKRYALLQILQSVLFYGTSIALKFFTVVVHSENVLYLGLRDMPHNVNLVFNYVYNTWYVCLELEILQLNIMIYCTIVEYSRVSFRTILVLP